MNDRGVENLGAEVSAKRAGYRLARHTPNILVNGTRVTVLWDEQPDFVPANKQKAKFCPEKDGTESVKSQWAGEPKTRVPVDSRPPVFPPRRLFSFVANLRRARWISSSQG
jgi:hypothetical protein